MHLDDVAVGTALVRVAVLGVFEQHVVHVYTSIKTITADPPR